MHLKLILGTAALAGSLFMACNTTSPTFTPSLVTERAWKLTALTANPPILANGVLVTNVFDSLPLVSACDKQRRTTYRPNNTILLATDSAACGIESDSLSWALNTDQTVLTVTKYESGGPKVTANTIISVTSTQLVVSWNLSPSEAPDSAAHVVTETYTAQ